MMIMTIIIHISQFEELFTPSFIILFFYVIFLFERFVRMYLHKSITSIHNML